MTKHTVTLIPGDGIGLETTASMRRVVEAAGVDIVWEVADAGAAVMERTGGSPLPEETIESVRRNKVAIKGPITTPVGTGFRSVNVALRKTLDLYACVRPVLSIPGAGGRYENVDLVVVRENTEDLYAGIEFPKDSEGAQRLIEFCEEQGTGTIRPDSGISIKPISVTATERIVRYAFEYALAHGRRKVTAVHKANIMKHSDGEVADAGAAVMERTGGSPLPEETIESVRRNKVAIKGPITTPVGTGFRSVNVALRKTLDLYACVRPVLSIPGAGGRYENVDLVVVRENTEDLYAGIEFPKDSEGAQRLIEFCEEQGTGTIRPDSGISIKPISVTATERIVRYAFEYALAHGRRKVTAVHKANIMKHSDGLFLQVARNVAEEYAGRVDFDDRIVDAFCMNVVIDPSQFDVIVFPNLYGDIASDLCAGLVGGLGIAPGANIGEDYAIFEAVHGSAPDIAGKDLCNPTAEILSAAMMLDYLGEDDAAQRIREAVRKVYAEGRFITGDIRKATGSDEPACSCTEFTDALVAALS